MKHHTLLHIDKQSQQRNDKESSTNTNQSANAKGTTTAEVNTYCSFKGKPKNYILLATAIVKIRNKSGQYVPCRALLDSASQSHFITERCVQNLRLRRAPTYASIHGIGNANTSTYDSVSIHLRSRHTEWHTTLDCAILDNITGTTPPTTLDTTSWKLLKDIKLADEQPGRIDILLGADIFYEILQSGRHTLSGNLPVLQETELGCTIYGRTAACTPRYPSFKGTSSSLRTSTAFGGVAKTSHGTQKQNFLLQTPDITQRFSKLKKTHQSHGILQKIHQQLQTSQGQQANNHSIHTRARPGSKLLCEDGTINLICTRNWRLDGASRGRSHQFSQDTAPIHSSGRSP
jgi:hypothetical protein